MPTQISPTFECETQFWQQNIKIIAGLDEVGMGALAGPVVAAAVIFGNEVTINNLRDSKKLSAKQREKASQLIKEKALAWAIGAASVAEISQINIRRAAHLAMRRAVDRLKIKPEILVIDGNPAQPHPLIPAMNIIKGDGTVASISAASIIAKVYRDQLMREMHQLYPAYGFDTHKGYGSALHLAALSQFGPCPEHRPTYAPVAAALTRLG